MLTVIAIVTVIVAAIVTRIALDFVKCHNVENAFVGHAGYQKMDNGQMVFVSYFGHESKAHRIAQWAREHYGVSVVLK